MKESGGWEVAFGIEKPVKLMHRYHNVYFGHRLRAQLQLLYFGLVAHKQLKHYKQALSLQACHLLLYYYLCV